jgi:hypothetical protein
MRRLCVREHVSMADGDCVVRIDCDPPSWVLQSPPRLFLPRCWGSRSERGGGWGVDSLEPRGLRLARERGRASGVCGKVSGKQ